MKEGKVHADHEAMEHEIHERDAHKDHVHEEHAGHGHAGDKHEGHEGHRHSHAKHHEMMTEDFKRRFIVSSILTVPILVLSPLIQRFLGFELTFPGDYYVLFLLSAVVYFYGGWPFLKGMQDELRKRTPGMMTLIALAITVAFSYSVAVTFGIPGKTFYWELATLIDIMLLAFPERYLPTMVPIFLVIEPCLVGFMFVGTEIFAEKEDGVIGALAVTPMKWRSYILAKTLILGVELVIGAALIMGIGTRSLSGLPYVLFGAFLASMVYTLLGIGISAKYRDLDDYFVPILGVMVVSLLPFAHYHGYLTGGIWKVLYAVPSYRALYFFKTPFVGVSAETLLLSGAALVIWSIAAYYFARIRFYRRAVEGLR
nr:hypothetical protein [Thermococcus sp.]